MRPASRAPQARHSTPRVHFSLSPAARGERTRALRSCTVSASSSDTRRHRAGTSSSCVSWSVRRSRAFAMHGSLRAFMRRDTSLCRPGACALSAAPSRVRPIPGTTFSSFSKLLLQTSFCRIHSAVGDDPLGLPGGSKPESAHALKAGRDPCELARSIPKWEQRWSCWAVGACHPAAAAAASPSPSGQRQRAASAAAANASVSPVRRGLRPSRIVSKWSAAARGGGRWWQW